MRINAFLSLAGVASRRKADELVKAGRVTINAQPAGLNSRVSEQDLVEVDGKRIVAQEFHYLLLNKPAGYVTTLSDPQGRPTVMDIAGNRDLKPVGRLDMNTEGLLILTNDGQLANKLMHPAGDFNKTYEVRVKGNITDEILNKLSNGVELEDGMSYPAEAVKIDESTISLTIHEGRNRQVRRMIAAVGLKLTHLRRTAYAGLTLDGLEMGHNRPLTADEVQRLKQMR